MVLGKKHAVGVDGDGRSAAAGGLPATPEAFKWMIEEFFLLSGRLDVRRGHDLVPQLAGSAWARQEVEEA